MSQREGPNRMVSSMSFLECSSQRVWPFSISLSQVWYLPSRTSPVVSPGLPKYSRDMRTNAWSPELERVGSVWHSLTKLHLGSPPMAAQPWFEATASWMAFHEMPPLPGGG